MQRTQEWENRSKCWTKCHKVAEYWYEKNCEYRCFFYLDNNAYRVPILLDGEKKRLGFEPTAAAKKDGTTRVPSSTVDVVDQECVPEQYWGVVTEVTRTCFTANSHSLLISWIAVCRLLTRGNLKYIKTYIRLDLALSWQRRKKKMKITYFVSFYE